MPRSLLLLAASLIALPAVHSQDVPNLSDAEVAHVAVTANTIDIENGRYAEPRATNPRVKAFAASMARDHARVNEMAAALATRLHVTPKDNAVSRSLLAGASEAHKTLETAKGAAFDRAYMDREIAYHQAVLDALDKVLILTTENAELKKLLIDVRPNFVGHLEAAKQIRAGLGS